MDYDLIVVGGGFTGVCAAVAASKEGAKTLLVEKSSFLGGAATNCLVNPFMKYFINVTAEDGSKQLHILNRGLFAEIVKRLNDFGAMLNKSVFNEEYLKIVLDRLCQENGVKVLLHTQFIGADCADGAVKNITVANKSGVSKLSARYYIDCSGDADLAASAGCSFRVGREEDNLCQPMTLCFRLSNVDLEKFAEERPQINVLYKKFQAEGRIKNIREDVLIFSSTNSNMLHFNTTRVVKMSPLNAFDITEAEMIAREQVLEMYMFLKNNFEAFKNCELLLTAPEIGVRESRLIDGEYIVTAEDFLSYKVFEDSVTCGAYGIDIHNPDGTGTYLKYLEEGRYYTIPYRSLVPKGIKNLLVAGRCISSTHEAQSAYRIMPIVANLGEAAGLAAWLAHKSNSAAKDVDIKELQKLLQKNNVQYK